MPNLKLTLACWDYDRTRPLMDGRVKPEGIDLDIKVMRPREMFPRMLEKKEFEVSELSLGHYVTLKGRGSCPFVAVPVALSKIFRHSCIYVRTDAGIRSPQDLRGKRVGATQLGSTGIIFMNGMMQHEYGVGLEDIQWFIGGLDSPTTRPMLPLNLPDKIKVDFLPADQTLEGMLEAGRLDALFALYIPSIFQKGSPCIARLFPNYYEVEQDYYRRTRIFPIMHTVVVRDDVHREHPWVAESMYKAFCEARDLAVDGLYDTDALRLSLPWLINHLEETWKVLGKDFWAYGLEPNRPALEAIGQYVYEQGFSPRAVSADELFAPNV
ncbi:MAG TPA: PhnD/SsuA/transferrin family substrate-binding protein [Candidatus Saccharimonadales bacterium]|nr:PhnD/SsuA/transferrin family substrate-binding protein [Candidatus Saccharimonadales bacterium]